MEKKMKTVGFLTGVILMVCLALAMALVSTIYTGAPLTVGGLLLTALSAFAINFAASLVIPAARLGQAFAVRFGAAAGSWRFILLSTLITTIIYVTIVSFGMTIIAVGFNEMLIPAWLQLYPILFVCGYVVAALLTKPAMMIASKIVGVAPAQ